MDGSLYIAATGMRAQQKALDVVANNIANINTSSFKRSEARFAELLSQSEGAGSEADQSIRAAGVSMDPTAKVFTQGELKNTGSGLDVAIRGEGFLELLGPGGGEVLWRGGRLKINADGYLAASNGMPLRAMISVPIDATSLTISGDGKVSAQLGSDSKPSSLGQIDLVRAKDPHHLIAAGEGLYRPSDNGELITADPGEEGAGTLVQGASENSNVQLSDEMVTLLLTQRAFAANAQVVQASDQLMSIVNGLKR